MGESGASEQSGKVKLETLIPASTLKLLNLPLLSEVVGNVVFVKSAAVAYALL